MTLRLIEGGGGGGGAGGVFFTPHPLADHLWNAIYPRGAKSLATVAARMSRSAGIEISEATARAVISHVRVHCFEYGWGVPPVEKGRYGINRKYIVELVDPNDPDTSISESDSGDHLIVVQRGTISTARTLATMGTNASNALEIFSNAPQLTLAEKRQFRKAASMFGAAADMVREVIARLA